MSGELERLSVAETALARATTIGQVSDIYDLAEAARRFAKSARDQNRAAVVKLKAARKGGEMLGDAVPHQGGRPATGNVASLATFFPDLPEYAREHLSERWQNLASIPEDAFADYLGGIDPDVDEITHASSSSMRPATGN